MSWWFSSVESIPSLKLRQVEEREIIDQLIIHLISSENATSISFGCMYTVNNSNLLFHYSKLFLNAKLVHRRCVHNQEKEGKITLEKEAGAFPASSQEDNTGTRPFAVNHVWYLTGVAKRLPCNKQDRNGYF